MFLSIYNNKSAIYMEKQSRVVSTIDRYGLLFIILDF